MSTLQSLHWPEKLEGFFVLPWTSTLYVWLIHPKELLTLHMYDPASEGTKSFRLNQVVHRLKYSFLPPFLSLKNFPPLYHFTMGRGFPSAEQSSFTDYPTGIVRKFPLILEARNSYSILVLNFLTIARNLPLTNTFKITVKTLFYLKCSTVLILWWWFRVLKNAGKNYWKQIGWNRRHFYLITRAYARGLLSSSLNGSSNCTGF